MTSPGDKNSPLPLIVLHFDLKAFTCQISTLFGSAVESLKSIIKTSGFLKLLPCAILKGIPCEEKLVIL